MGWMNWGTLVRLGAWLEVQLGMEVLSIGRSADDVEDCVMIVHGKYLGFRVATHKLRISLSAKVLDIGDEDWEFIFQIAENGDGWKTISQLLRALEREHVKSLERPIEAGLGPNGFIIGEP